MDASNKHTIHSKGEHGFVVRGKKKCHIPPSQNPTPHGGLVRRTTSNFFESK